MPTTPAGTVATGTGAVTPNLSTTRPTTGNNAGPPPFPGSTPQDVVTQAGQSVNADGLTVTSGALRPGDGVLGSTLCTPVHYQNGTDTPVAFNSMFDWKVQDPNGAIVMATFVGSARMLNSGQLAPGGQASGDVCFQSPTDEASGQYVVLYDPPFRFSSERVAWLNQR